MSIENNASEMTMDQMLTVYVDGLKALNSSDLGLVRSIATLFYMKGVNDGKDSAREEQKILQKLRDLK